VTQLLLLAEDDVRITSMIARGLRAEGYELECVGDGHAALQAAMSGRHALLILDRRLPGLEGVEVSRRLRSAGSRCRILMLTAMDRLQDKVEGLRGGADDYLTKPFAFEELLARIEALLRRDGDEPDRRELTVGDLRIDLDAKAAWRGERRLLLTSREFDLLVCLARQPGTVLSRAQLRGQVWNRHFETGTKIVEVYVRYLRRKIDEGTDCPLIHTVRGFGYTLSVTPPSSAGPTGPA
jgi:DNA-binding response OmpR family regulator